VVFWVGAGFPPRDWVDPSGVTLERLDVFISLGFMVDLLRFRLETDLRCLETG